MKRDISLSGDLKNTDFPSLLLQIYLNEMSGILKVSGDKFNKQFFITNRKIDFASSDRQDDSFGNYLLKKNLITRTMFQKANESMKKSGRKFGRTLLELGYFDTETMWSEIQNHLKDIVFSMFSISEGKYEISMNYTTNEENIRIDCHILSVIVDGIRRFVPNEFISRKFENIQHLYLYRIKTLAEIDLKSYENHIYELVKREANVIKIIEKSELLKTDTLRILYLLLILEVISEKRIEEAPVVEDKENIMGINSFSSFEEALRYYNLKYGLIFKVLSKEIGPIALSILLKAIESVVDNLPPYLKKIELDSAGGLVEKKILKSVWYHDFNVISGDFIRGLEEVLYAEIYAVKKHLGIEYEHQILKWIKGKET